MEVVPCEGYRFLLLDGKFDFNRVEVGIELTLNSQACGGRGAGDEVTMVWYVSSGRPRQL
jgi:hypothetical protein